MYLQHCLQLAQHRFRGMANVPSHLQEIGQVWANNFYWSVDDFPVDAFLKRLFHTRIVLCDFFSSELTVHARGTPIVATNCPKFDAPQASTCVPISHRRDSSILWNNIAKHAIRRSSPFYILVDDLLSGCPCRNFERSGATIDFGVRPPIQTNPHDQGDSVACNDACTEPV